MVKKALVLFLWMLSIWPTLGWGCQDWNQWGGTTRQFVANSMKLFDDENYQDWRELWRFGIGSGNSGIVITGDVGYTAYTKNGKERVIAFSLSTGKLIWERMFVIRPREFMDLEFGLGPHATPAVAGDKLVCVGLTGRLSALNLSDGKTVWEKELWVGESYSKLERGMTCSPVRYEDCVIVSPGGTGTAFQAYDLATGRQRWSRHDFKSAYASPVVAKICGQPQLVQLMDQHLVGLDPRSGDLLWEYPVPTERYVNCASPVIGPGNRVFYNSCDGLRAVDIERSSGRFVVDPGWTSRITICQTSNFVLTEGMLLGAKEGAVFAAVDARTGRTLWRSRELRDCSIVLVGSSILAVREDGRVSVAKASRSGIESKWSKDLLDGRCWVGPAIGADFILLRDSEKLIKLGLQ